MPVDLDENVLLIAGALALLTGLVFGLVPALQSTRPDLIASLRAQAGQTGGNRRAARFRLLLATTQIALSMALLVSAGLFTRSLHNISMVDLGLQVDNVVTFRLSPGMNGYTPQRALALFEEVEAALAAMPGVSGVTASRLPLLAGSGSGRDVQVQGFVAGLDTDRSSRYNTIGTDYFRTLGIPVLAGREFLASDALGTPKVAIVNEAFVRKFQLGADALGLRIASDGSDVLDTEIVGVVGDTRFAGVKNEKPPQFYLPYRQDDLIAMMSFLRADRPGSAALVGSVPTLVSQTRCGSPGSGAEDPAAAGLRQRVHRPRCQRARGALRGIGHDPRRHRPVRRAGLHRCTTHEGDWRANGARRQSVGARDDPDASGGHGGRWRSRWSRRGGRSGTNGAIAAV